MLPETFDPSPFTIPLVYALPEPKMFLDKPIGAVLQDEIQGRGVVRRTFSDLLFERCTESGIADPYHPKKPLKMPSENDAPLDEIVKAISKERRSSISSSPPFRSSSRTRTASATCMSLGGSGAGKTTLLQNLILMTCISENPPSLVIIDSQGDLINKLSRLALFDPDMARSRAASSSLSPEGHQASARAQHLRCEPRAARQV